MPPACAAIRPSARNAARHPTARGVARAAWTLACGLALGCAGATPAVVQPAAATPAPAPAGALVVELAFGAEADLDLYVSDPDHETAYFANTPVRSGGSFERDLRCGDAAPRVERVVWPAPPPGRYRVGVDFPERCVDVDSAPWQLRVQGPGVREELAGEAAFGRFDARALEFEVGD